MPIIIYALLHNMLANIIYKINNSCSIQNINGIIYYVKEDKKDLMPVYKMSLTDAMPPYIRNHGILQLHNDFFVIGTFDNKTNFDTQNLISKENISQRISDVKQIKSLTGPEYITICKINDKLHSFIDNEFKMIPILRLSLTKAYPLNYENTCFFYDIDNPICIGTLDGVNDISGNPIETDGLPVIDQ